MNPQKPIRWLPRLFRAGFICGACEVGAQIAFSPDDSNSDIPVNYPESRVGDYELPELLILSNGQAVSDVET